MTPRRCDAKGCFNPVGDDGEVFCTGDAICRECSDTVAAWLDERNANTASPGPTVDLDLS